MRQPPPLADAITSTIRSLLAEVEAPSRRQFSLSSGLPESTLRSAAEPGWNPTVRTVDQLLAAFPPHVRLRALNQIKRAIQCAQDSEFDGIVNAYATVSGHARGPAPRIEDAA